ncbi:hypothetical protein B0H10DRAFT_261606 [Mycena sp. CBHHK59/15]|nr:hypothetical protein B0H10DRAFT_261606 [Mycena sp. CBHHK59/15]
MQKRQSRRIYEGQHNDSRQPIYCSSEPTRSLRGPGTELKHPLGKRSPANDTIRTRRGIINGASQLLATAERAPRCALRTSSTASIRPSNVTSPSPSDVSRWRAFSAPVSRVAAGSLETLQVPWHLYPAHPITLLPRHLRRPPPQSPFPVLFGPAIAPSPSTTINRIGYYGYCPRASPASLLMRHMYCRVDASRMSATLHACLAWDGAAQHTVAIAACTQPHRRESRKSFRTLDILAPNVHIRPQPTPVNARAVPVALPLCSCARPPPTRLASFGVSSGATVRALTFTSLGMRAS